MIGTIVVLTGMMVCGVTWWQGNHSGSLAGLGTMMVGVMISIYEVFTYKVKRDVLSSHE